MLFRSITHFSISGGGDGGLAAKSCLTLSVRLSP